MRSPVKLRHLPPRIATGAFIIDSGIAKLSADDETAKGLHAAAVSAYPFLANVDETTFVQLLASAEITLGAALLVPVVPTRLAALGLLAFSGGLVGLYLRTPGATRQGSVGPTRDGIALAKDSWMLGIALGLLIDA